MISSEVVSDRAAKIPPEWNQRTPPAKIFAQSKSPGLEQRGGLVGAVVEDHRRANPLAPVAVHRRDVRTAHAVVLEPLVKRRDARLAYPALHQLADRVVDHRGRYAGAQAEAVRQVGGDVVLAAGDVDVERARLAERDHPRIEPVDERPQRQKIELGRFLTQIQPAHRRPPNLAKRRV